MDGSKFYTLCGDPHYFAPEVVQQRGYDYAVDLWAFGVLLFELYEGESPFGDEDATDAELYSSIGGFGVGDTLPFTDKSPPAARALATMLLDPIPAQRPGYLNPRDVEDDPFFEGMLTRPEPDPAAAAPAALIDTADVVDVAQVPPPPS